MAHSHLLVQHLLKQLEHHKRERNKRELRPEWLSVFIHQAAAVFEPLRGVARVGSDCELTSDGWEVRLYLGSTEIVGGKDDGHTQLVSFDLDFDRLSQVFTRLDEFRWSVAGGIDGTNSSFVTMTGFVDDHPIRLKVYSRPPLEAGPAFRQNIHGKLDSVSF